MMTRRFLTHGVAAMIGMTALLGFAVRPAAAVQVTLRGDGYVVAAAAAKTGTKATLKVNESTATEALVKFDLSALPGTVDSFRIAKATLRLYVQKLTAVGAVDVKMVTTAWSDADIGLVKPTVGVSVSTNVAVNARYDWVSIDVTVPVISWLDSPASNHGLAIIPKSGSGIKAEFDSKESKTTSQAPQLEIVLSSTGLESIPSTDISFWDPTGNMNLAVGGGALANNIDGSENTAVGEAALVSNIDGYQNTAVGTGALDLNTTGIGNTAVGATSADNDTTGSYNTAVGLRALALNQTGSDNTAVGHGALSHSNSATAVNTAVGSEALTANTSGDYNTALGYQTLVLNDVGSRNTALGYRALATNVSGGYNTAVGQGALGAATGSTNTALGRNAGSELTTGNNNIDIGNEGVAGESATTRIGTAATQTRAFVAGVYGVAGTGNVAVVTSSGQLVAPASSRRYKEEIRSMADTDGLLRLRPVTFRYKRDLDPEGIIQYGLIAEEVAEVMPGLVNYDKDGRPESVRYNFLAPILLNEFQKQNTTLQKQSAALEQVRVENEHIRVDNAQLRAQVQEIGALKTRLEAVEAALPAVGGRPALRAAAAREY